MKTRLVARGIKNIAIGLAFFVLGLSLMPRDASAAIAVPDFGAYFGGYGQSDGQMRSPRAVAVNPSNGNLYVTDYFNRRIVVFNSEGVWQFNFGSQGSGDGQLNLPTDIAISDDGQKVFVLDYFNNRIQIFNPDGIYQSQIPSTGGIGWPLALTLNSDSTRLAVLWRGVSPGNLNMVKIYDTSNNNELSSWNSASAMSSPFIVPTGIAYAPGDTTLLISDQDASIIRFFDVGGFAIPPYQMGSFGSGESQFTGISDIEISPDGSSILVTDSDNSRIQIFDLATKAFAGQIGTGASGSTYEEFDNPSGMAFSADGSKLYIVDGDNARIKVYNLQGSDPEEPNEPNEPNNPNAPDPQENTLGSPSTPKPPRTGSLLGASLITISLISIVFLLAQEIETKHLHKERSKSKFH